MVPVIPPLTPAGVALTLEAGKDAYVLGRSLDILEDKEKRWTIEDVSSAAFDQKFQPADRGSLNAGYTDSAFWVRFRLTNQTNNKYWFLEYGRPYMDQIRYYYPSGSGTYHMSEGGDLAPFNKREFKHRNFLFPLVLMTDEEQTFYMRFETKGTMVIPLNLWTHGSFYRKDHNEQIILGLYYGMIGVMIIYNLFLFFSLRDRSYIYYVFYISCVAFSLSISNGLAYEYIWPNSPWLQNNAMRISISLSVFWLLLFTRVFLNTRLHIPRFDKILSGLVLIAVFAMIFGLFVSNRTFANLFPFQIIFVLSILYAGFTCLRKNIRPARFFFIAFFLTLISMLVSTIRIIGFIPETFLTFHNIQISSAIEAVLLSIALADRINHLKQQTLDAQKSLLRRLKREDQLKSELNEELEQRVEERTLEIQAANLRLREEISNHQQTERQRQQLATAVTQAAEGIFIIGKDGLFKYVNPGFEKAVAQTSEELLGRDYRVILRENIYLEENGNAAEILQSGNMWKCRLIATQGQASRFEGEVTISPVMGESREVSHYVGIIHDVTEKIQLEKQLQQSQKMEALGTLAGGIAHDFNNILGTILGYTELMLDDETVGNEQKGLLEEVYKSGQRATDLVKQILLFSRIEDRNFKPVQISSLIKDTLKMMRSILPVTIQIEQKIEPDCAPVFASAIQIEQVVINLCTNSGYVMKEDGGTLQVSLEACPFEKARQFLPDLQKRDYLKLSISDSGGGIDVDIAERIFDPFFTTKGPGEGTGLGLSVVHGIAKNHGGGIVLENAPGIGATFHLLLPTVSNEPQLNAVRDAGESKGQEHILIVEDELSLAKFYQIVLQKLGYKISVAHDSELALQTVRDQAESIDLVFTDQTMPNLSGAALSREILSIRPELPIILATGFSSAISEKEAKEIGIRQFLLKPIKKDILAAAIRTILDTAHPPESQQPAD